MDVLLAHATYRLLQEFKAMSFHNVDDLIEELKQGRMIIIVDDKNRENEGDLVLPADFVDARAINFMSLKARGLICVALTHGQTQKLGLPLMVDSEKNLSSNKTAFTVSVEAKEGVSTGISPADRATTIKAVSSPSAKPEDIISPGHVFPIRAQKGGVLKRAGHTEASVDFCRLAGLNPAAVICEIISPDGTMARLKELKKFSQKHNIKIGSIEDLIRYRITYESFVEQTVKAPFASRMCEGFEVRVFLDKMTRLEHLAFTKGNVSDGRPVLTRVHSACLMGDLFGEELSQSGRYLHQALKTIDRSGRGVLIYLRSQKEALSHRINLYRNKSLNQGEGVFLDQKDYGVGAQILRTLGVSKIILLSNSRQKRVGLKGYGLEIISTQPLLQSQKPENPRVLKKSGQ